MDTNRYCSIDAKEVLHDIIGSIEHRPHQLFLEVPEPWDRTFSLSQNFPQRLALLLKTLAKKGKNITTSIFAPDAEYSKAGFLRVFYLRARPELVRYDKYEFLLEADTVTDKLEQILTAPDPGTHEFSALQSSSREYFICAHFLRDRCCGVFGQALFEKLRQDPEIKKEGIRIFKSSHIGGHRYAPTMLESPTLGCWGLLEMPIARQIILRMGEMENVIDHYRGSALYDSPFFQVAEREVMRRVGWNWFDAQERSLTGQVQKESGVAQVSCSIKNRKQKFSVETYLTDPILLRANCADNETHSFPQYRIKATLPV